MRRRALLAGLLTLGVVAKARAQQPTIPVIGFVHLTSPEAREREVLAAFHRGLSDTGYIEGRNVTLDYLWARGQNDRLAPLVADLVRRQVSVIVALESTNSALAAKAATQRIPIVFMQAARPGPDRPRRQSQPTRRKCHRHRPVWGRSGRKASRVAAGIGACRHIDRLPSQPDQPHFCRERNERDADGCACSWGKPPVC